MFLITSGGTRVPLDDVRYIDNFSKGGFGAKLAISAATLLQSKREANHVNPGEVVLLRAERAVSVEQRPWGDGLGIQEHLYNTYDEYSNTLQRIIHSQKFEFVFSAAAVSDFAPLKVAGKIDSDIPYTITMSPLPKVLPQLRNWSMNPKIVQVGFKLLSDVSDEQLIEVAREKGAKAGSDWTIANTLQTVANKQHHIFLVENGGQNRVKRFRVQLQREVDVFLMEFLEMSGKLHLCV